MIKLFPHKPSIWARVDFDGTEDFGRWAYGGKGGGGAPPAPDPAETARVQGQMNRETAVAQARLNQVNEYGPYGSSVYSERKDAQGNPIVQDDIVQFDRTQTLNPADQAQLDRERNITQQLTETGEGQLNRINQNIGEEFNYEGLPEAAVGTDEERRRIEDYLYNSAKSRLDPRFNQEQQRLETQLANQGITRGTDAWQRESGNFARNKNDAYQQALAGAISAGGSEQSRQFGLNQSARQQGITERLGQRNQPLNELATLLGTSPQVGQPSFAPIPTGGIAAPDYQGAVANNYAGQMNAYGMNQQAGAARSSALMGLAGTGIMAGAMF